MNKLPTKSSFTEIKNFWLKISLSTMSRLCFRLWDWAISLEESLFCNRLKGKRKWWTQNFLTLRLRPGCQFWARLPSLWFTRLMRKSFSVFRTVSKEWLLKGFLRPNTLMSTILRLRLMNKSSGRNTQKSWWEMWSQQKRAIAHQVSGHDLKKIIWKWYFRLFSVDITHK